jgi:hypothetical protein
MSVFSSYSLLPNSVATSVSNVSNITSVSATSISATSVSGLASRRARFLNSISSIGNPSVVAGTTCTCGRPSGSCVCSSPLGTCVCNTTTGPLVPNGIAIIGDSAGSILLATLLENSLNTEITVINTGPDILSGNVNYVQQIAYPALTSIAGQVFTSLKPITINVVNSDISNTQVLSYQYYAPSGLMGDIIQAYRTLTLGPWFPLQTIGMQNLTRFFRNNLMITPLNPTELLIAQRMSVTFGIPIIRSVFTKVPAILGETISLTVAPIGGFQTVVRNLFTEAVFNFPGKIVNNATNIQVGFVGTVAVGNSNRPRNIYNICGNGFSLHNVELFWKTDPYAFLQLASTSNNGCVNPCGNFNSGAFNGVLYLPAVYRAVLPIPITNPNGISFPSADQATPDGIIAQLNWSLSANKSTNNIVWLMSGAVATDDFYSVQLGGSYPPPGHYFLIIEGVAGNNTRKTQWNPTTNAIEVSLNSHQREATTSTHFADIVSGIYNAIVGSTVYSAQMLLGVIQSCTVNSCSDNILISDLPTRQIPIITILSLINALYPSNSGILSLFPTGG